MMKNDKKMKKNEKNSGKIAIFHFLENCNFPRVCFSFFFHFFSFFHHFFIIFHHFSSFFIDSTTGSKNDKKMINNDKKMKKTRGKLHFFYFSENFWSTGSKNDEN